MRRYVFGPAAVVILAISSLSLAGCSTLQTDAAEQGSWRYWGVADAGTSRDETARKPAIQDKASSGNDNKSSRAKAEHQDKN